MSSLAHPKCSPLRLNRFVFLSSSVSIGILVGLLLEPGKGAALAAAVERYGEAVFKPLFTSKARGMTVIGHGPGAREAVEAFHAENPIMYMQQKIELPGQDLGVVFLGGRYMTTYARCGTGAWNTTTASGGKYAAATPSPEAVAMAEKAQALFNLDFTCVDVVETSAGPVVFEVSAFGGFRGIQEACGMDAAAMYTDYVMEKIRGS